LYPWSHCGGKPEIVQGTKCFAFRLQSFAAWAGFPSGGRGLQSQDPEFTAFYNQNMNALKGNYQTAIDEVSAEARRIFKAD
jgi:hypothetical protein